MERREGDVGMVKITRGIILGKKEVGNSSWGGADETHGGRTMSLFEFGDPL